MNTNKTRTKVASALEGLRSFEAVFQYILHIGILFYATPPEPLYSKVQLEVCNLDN